MYTLLSFDLYSIQSINEPSFCSPAWVASSCCKADLSGIVSRGRCLESLAPVFCLRNGAYLVDLSFGRDKTVEI